MVAKRTFLAVLLIGLLGAAWVGYGRLPVVEVVHPQMRPVVESVAATGQVAGRSESDVGAEVGGRIAAVLVNEGDRVYAGQVLARLDQGLLLKQVDQSQAALKNAEARLAQASRPTLESELERARAEVRQQRDEAEAQLRAAQEHLRELQTGPTREELTQAEGQARQAESQMTQAQREMLRQERLLQDGAISRQDAERARTSYQVARAANQTAQARLKQLQVGTRVESVEQAASTVRQAQARLQGAQEAGRARLRTLAEQPRPEDVAVATTALQEAREALGVARERLRQSEIRAPYAGQVTKLFLKAGQLTGPGAPVLHMVRLPGLEIQVAVDETNLDRLKIGQSALISCDAYPDTFRAQVREIAPAVSAERGTVQLKLRPEDPPQWLRPGLTVSVNLLVAPEETLPIVPLTCVSRVGREAWVMVVERSVLRRRSVATAPAGPEGYPILKGLTQDDLVVLDPDAWEPGRRVRSRLSR